MVIWAVALAASRMAPVANWSCMVVDRYGVSLLCCVVLIYKGGRGRILECRVD
jgi:hypothetical protein